MTTVSELIEQLSKLDQSQQINIDDYTDFHLVSYRVGNKGYRYGLDSELTPSVDDYQVLHTFPKTD